MSWVQLDDRFHANPKVVSVGNAGAGLYARALSYCGDHLTDGFVPKGWAREIGGQTLPKKLVEAGLWESVDGGFSIPDYLTVNPSRAAVLARRSELAQIRAEAGRKGAQARWGDGKQDGKPIANTMANECQTVWQPDSPQSPTPKSEGEKGSVRVDLEAVRSETTAPAESNGLPVSHELKVVALLKWIGKHADDETPDVLRSFARRAPEAALARVLETARDKHPANRAGYVIAALKSELEPTT